MALNYAAYCINFLGNYNGRCRCLTSSVSEAAVEDTFMTPPPPLTPLSNGVMPMPAPPPPLRTSPASKKRLSKISPAEMLDEEA